MHDVMTIGYARFSVDTFMERVKTYGIEVVVDVRSVPWSRYKPCFSKDPLRDSLRSRGVSYLFMGDTLGAKPDSPSYYIDGRFSYAAFGRSAAYRRGLDRLLSGISRYRIAIMCAEKDPIDCHRGIMICRSLKAANVRISHVLSGEEAELNAAMEARLLRLYGLHENELFSDTAMRIEEAYDRRALEIAHERKA